MYDLIYHHVIIKLGGGNVPELDNLLLLFLFLVSFLLSFEKAWKIFISLVILLSSNHLSAWVCCVCPGISQSPRLTHTALKKPACCKDWVTSIHIRGRQNGQPGPCNRQLISCLAYSGYLIKHLNRYPIGTRIGYPKGITGSRGSLVSAASSSPTAWSQADLASKAIPSLRALVKWSRAHSAPSTKPCLDAPSTT